MPFNPESFMNSVYDQAGSTRGTPVPEGDYNAYVRSVTARELHTKNGVRPVLDLLWDIEDTTGLVKEATGRDKNAVPQTIWLDLTPEGNLDLSKGKNTGLNRVREVFDLNQNGRQFSPRMFEGKGPALVTVKHRADENDPTEVYSSVTKVAKI